MNGVAVKQPMPIPSNAPLSDCLVHDLLERSLAGHDLTVPLFDSAAAINAELDRYLAP
jgi:hypothetical protein